MLGLGRDKGLVGVDIGSYSIKAVELKSKKKEGELQYEVSKIGYELLPHDAIVEGTIIDSAAVVETIKMVFDENKITNKNVVISISGNWQFPRVRDSEDLPRTGDSPATNAHRNGSEILDRSVCIPTVVFVIQNIQI